MSGEDMQKNKHKYRHPHHTHVFAHGKFKEGLRK